jgi:hypothetical protein
MRISVREDPRSRVDRLFAESIDLCAAPFDSRPASDDLRAGPIVVDGRSIDVEATMLDSAGVSIGRDRASTGVDPLRRELLPGRLTVGLARRSSASPQTARRALLRP